MAASSSVSLVCPGGNFVDLTDLKCVDQLLVARTSKETSFPVSDLPEDAESAIHRPFLHHLNGEPADWKDWQDMGVLDLAVEQYRGRRSEGSVDISSLRRERRRKQNDYFRSWWEEQKRSSFDLCELNDSSYGEQTQEIVEDSEETDRDILVFDSDTSTRYNVKGIGAHELPVIGFHIDPRILPGFCYLVRPNGSRRPLFNGRALPLQRIGMGYGKRITFKGESPNNNTHYFWSDSRPEGYAFSLQAVVPGDQYVVQDQRERLVGHAHIDRVDPFQLETLTTTTVGCTEKRVQVTAWCTVDFGEWSETNVCVSGTAHVVKKKGWREAVTLKVEGVDIPSVGLCTLFVRK